MFNYRATWYAEDYPILYNGTTSDNSLPSESKRYMYIYGTLTASLVVLSCIRVVNYYLFTTLAAKNLHNEMFSIVLRAPMSFFERNPVGT